MSIPVIGGPGFNAPGAEDDPMVSDGKIHVLFQLMTESYLERLVRKGPVVTFEQTGPGVESR